MFFCLCKKAEGAATHKPSFYFSPHYMWPFSLSDTRSVAAATTVGSESFLIKLMSHFINVACVSHLGNKP